MKILYYIPKIYMSGNWFEILYYCSNLVTFATIETKSQEKKEKNNNTQLVI